MKIRKLRVCIFLLLSFILVSVLFSSKISMIMEDTFDDLDNWILYGSPEPIIISEFQGRRDLFDSMGDDWCDSGAVTKKLYDLLPPFVIEADVNIVGNLVKTCWDEISIGIARRDPGTEGVCAYEYYPSILSFKVGIQGEPCWATPKELRDHAYFRGGYLTSTGKSVGFGTRSRKVADRFVNTGWHRMRIVVTERRTVEFYMDGELVWKSDRRIDKEALRNIRIMVGGRSSGVGGGKNFVDWMRVYRKLKKAIWVYHPERYDLSELISNLKEAGVDLVFLSVRPGRLNEYREFLRRAHEEGMEVYATTLEDPVFVKAHDSALSIIDEILEFNERSSEKFDGLNIDVEPYAGGYKIDEVWEEYVELLRKVYDKVGGRTTVSIDIPRWYSEKRIKEISPYTDFFVVMAYDSGDKSWNNVSKISKVVKGEMEAFRKNGGVAMIGIGVHESFESLEDLENCVYGLFDHYSKSSIFLGVSIFEYDNYMKLKSASAMSKVNVSFIVIPLSSSLLSFAEHDLVLELIGPRGYRKRLKEADVPSMMPVIFYDIPLIPGHYTIKATWGDQTRVWHKYIVHDTLEIKLMF